MKFHYFVLQMNGAITDRKEYDSAVFRRGVLHRALMDLFDGFLGDRPSAHLRLPLLARCPIALEWNRSKPFLAMGTFFVMRKPAVTCLFFADGEECPAVFAIPWPPTLGRQEQMIVGTLSACLAAGFFEREVDARKRSQGLERRRTSNYSASPN
ncbi:hypothetical protein AYO40_00640 [Planctomycetaceae bacterium SCGC AG-212-D15]|nr:hypothetical protein AYO40_00640 [Planctomycetaceae bacterium SCGC AG-212-D15]